MLGEQLAVMGRTKVNRLQWHNMLIEVNVDGEETSRDDA